MQIVVHLLLVCPCGLCRSSSYIECVMSISNFYSAAIICNWLITRVSSHLVLDDWFDVYFNPLLFGSVAHCCMSVK